MWVFHTLQLVAHAQVAVERRGQEGGIGKQASGKEARGKRMADAK
jgi:succinyl-CoA synthetase beta subunit